MTETQSTPAANLIIGNGTAVHALTTLGIPNHPLCGKIRSNGRGQRIRRTDLPVTCASCLTKSAK